MGPAAARPLPLLLPLMLVVYSVSAAECPAGIDPAQWAALDTEEQVQVAEQVAALQPPPPLEIEAEEDASVAWEEWSAEKHAAAWAEINGAVEAGGVADGEAVKQVVASLLRRGWRPLHVAAAGGRLADAQQVLDFLAPVVSRVEQLRDKRGLTALHQAALAGEVAVMKLLLPDGKLKKNARASLVDPEDRHGSRPLHHAAGQGELEAMRLLLKKGAAIDAQTIAQATPLHVAASTGQVEAMRLLAEQGAGLLLEDALGSTPLGVANSTGHDGAIEAMAGLLQARIREVYVRFMPADKREGVDALLEEWAGWEEELLHIVLDTVHKTEAKLKAELAGPDGGEGEGTAEPTAQKKKKQKKKKKKKKKAKKNTL
jgi:hypothetical protein